MEHDREEFTRRPKKVGFNVVGLALFALGVGVTTLVAWRLALAPGAFAGVLIGGVILSAILALAPRVANQWEKAVVLRLGRFTALKGPGLFWVFPLVDRIT
ncbi:MAG: hypothetical protein ACYTF8_09020, partial [Planctomycetota bacterium]